MVDGVKKSLQVTFETVEFAKEFHYFLTAQIDGEGVKVIQNFHYNKRNVLIYLHV